MTSYQLKIAVPENKIDEFIDSLIDISSEIRDEEGCIDFSVYWDLEKKDTYSVLGEFNTRQSMEKHFKHKLYVVLIGAIQVLGKDFEMRISETLEKGSYQFAREKTSLHSGKDKTSDINF